MRKKHRLLFLVSFLAAGAPGCGNTPAPEPSAKRPVAAQPGKPTAVTNVTVVDVMGGTSVAGMTVVTNAGLIAAIGRGIAVPPDAVQVDGTGKFLIPGLWDMHAHHQGTGTESLDLFLANGVLATRDMGSDADFILPLRDRINRGELLGPEIVAAGPILDDRPRDWPFRRHITNAAEARQAVGDLKARGVDFVKVHDGTPRDAFFAIAEETARLGLPFAGHVPMNVTVEEAADSGIKSIEHFANFRVFRDCSGNEPYSAARCQPLFEKLAAKGVWQTPTIAMISAVPDMFSGKPLPHGEYASDALLEITRKNVEASKLSEEALSFFRSNAKTSLAVIRDMLARGNGFLAGCDGLVSGFCLHDELRWFTEAGMSPLQALQTATINPVRLLGREKTQGTIEVGKRADLVLLEADPLADIGNARRIAAVLVRDRLLSKTDIDRMLTARRRASASSF